MITRKDIDVRGPTAVNQHHVAPALAWTSETLGGKAGLVQDLSEPQLRALNEIVDRTRHLAPHAVTRREFDHPTVNGLLADLRTRLVDGAGVVILRGISREHYSEEDCERIFWGFGTHLGDAAIQSVSGERMGHVRYETANPHNRGYRDRVELLPHTDSYAIVGLMCLEAAASGGESQLVSTLAIHNEFLKNRPELLEPLYRGYPTAIYEARHWKNPVTDFNVPIFSSIDDKISCLYTPRYIREASEQLGTPVPPALAEALSYLQELSTRKDLMVEFTLDPGEMMLWNNYILLHSRSAFEDSETQHRHLLRLWLKSPGCRPVLPELHTWGLMYERLFGEKTSATLIDA